MIQKAKKEGWFLQEHMHKKRRDRIKHNARDESHESYNLNYLSRHEDGDQTTLVIGNS
jgi:hypothetical protein